MSTWTTTIATLDIFNTTRRKRLMLHDFDEPVVESRCCCTRLQSVGPTVTDVEHRRTEHHTKAGRVIGDGVHHRERTANRNCSGLVSNCWRKPVNPRKSPWRTVTTKSGPTKIMMSPVSTISRASATDSCGTYCTFLSTRNSVSS
jgi:hypothetical protein